MVPETENDYGSFLVAVTDDPASAVLVPVNAHTEHMQGTEIGGDNSTSQHDDGKCCSLHSAGIVDISEPLFYILALLTCIGLAYVGIADFSTLMMIIMVYAVLASLIAIWRIRKLGVAKSLMDSVMTLNEENEELRLSVERLQSQTLSLEKVNVRLRASITELCRETEAYKKENTRFSKLVGLLDSNVSDFETSKAVLLKDIERLETANLRYEANNLMNLFFLVDRDQGGYITPDEMEKMNEYTRAVYGLDLDLATMDRNTDGKVDVKEFVAEVEKQMTASRSSPSSPQGHTTVD